MSGENEDTLEADVLYVGAGPAALASAIRLVTSGKKNGLALNVVMIEKAKVPGAHQLSGAVLDPVSFKEVLIDLGVDDPELGTPVSDDFFYFLSKKGGVKLPFTPPSLRNHGNVVIALSELVGWLAERAQALGINILSGFAGAELLWDGDRVIGVKTGDKGINRKGEKKPNFEPGVKIKAKVTVLAEGVRGSLTKGLTERLHLGAGQNPQSYTSGVKEIWKVKKDKHVPGRVIHTMGWPLDQRTFGGGFVYHAKGERIYLGLVVGLDYENPHLDLHEIFSKFKQHPMIAELLKDGEMLKYGAKALPEGGYYSIPRYWGDGFLIIGDSASFLNAARLKGIHLAMKSGQLAAEAILKVWQKGDFSREALGVFKELVENSIIKRELWSVRNFHQGFRWGLWGGLMQFSFQMITGGNGLLGKLRSGEDHKQLKKLKNVSAPSEQEKVVFDEKLTFPKLTDVFKSGTAHDEDQPVHLLVADTEICRVRCREEYGNPCEHFCPANVYEMVDADDGRKQLKINATNCVHCKTCDIKDPYGIITWVPPEGGGGPDYVGM